MATENSRSASSETVGEIELAPRAAINDGALVGLINSAYTRYDILVAPRISLEGFRAEAHPDSDFLLMRREGRLIACAMLVPAPRFFESSGQADNTKPGWVVVKDGTSPLATSGVPAGHVDHPYGGDLADAVYFGLAAVEPDAQGSGAGRLLAARIEEIARARGFRRVVLTTLRQFGLTEYYGRMGFRECASEHFPAGHWSVVVPHDYCYMAKDV